MDGKQIAAAAQQNDPVKWHGTTYICVGYKRIFDKRIGIINSAILEDSMGRLYDVRIREVEKHG